VFGMVLTLVGAVAALLGLGGFRQNAFSGLGFRISSAGPGLTDERPHSSLAISS
jgi:hypothetical protein